MTEIEGPLGTVVDEIYRDGVVKGRAEADRLIGEAKEAAEAIVDSAQKEAAEIVRQAHATATRESHKIKGELDLAARDAMIQLQQDLAEALVSLLQPKVTRLMDDESFIATQVEKLLGDTTSGHHARQELHLSELYQSGLFENLLAQVATDDTQTSAVYFDLRQRGFEYRIDDSIVEITDESILEILRRYVSKRTYEHLAHLSARRG